MNEEDVQGMIDRMVAERLDKAQADMSKDIFAEELLSVTNNDSERDLIKHHYEHTIRQSGFSRTAIKEDLFKAKAIANANRLQKQNTELVETVKAKQAMGNSAVGSNQAKPTPTEDISKQFSERDWQFMQKRGWSEEMIKQAAARKAAMSL